MRSTRLPARASALLTLALGLPLACGGSGDTGEAPGGGAASGAAGATSGKGGAAGSNAGAAGSSAGAGAAGSNAGAAGSSAGAAGANAGAAGSSAGAGAGAAGSNAGAAGSSAGAAGSNAGAAGSSAGAGAAGSNAGAAGSSAGAGAAGSNAGAAGSNGGFSGSNAGTAGASGGAPGCVPACSNGKFCSSKGTCLDVGQCAGDPDCGPGTVCDPAKKACVPGSSCGVTKITADIVPPNLLVVLDRSCSMTAAVGTPATPKWTLAVQALTKLTTTYAAKIRFGLTLFPDTDTNKCGQGAIPIPVGPAKEPPIQSLLKASLAKTDSNYPDGPCVTNIDTAVQQAATDPGLSDLDRKSYVLLVSDGAQAGCSAGGGNKGTEAAVSTLHGKGVDTYVLGFGAKSNAAELNKLADLGGVPTGDPVTHYYLAEDGAQLEAALSTIAKKSLSCTVQLGTAPPDPDAIHVFFNGSSEITKDKTHKDGWDYDAGKNQVIFYGPQCTDLTAGKVSALDVVFGCPGGQPPLTCPTPGKIGCDAAHLCPDDPGKGQGFCRDGCCDFIKP